MPTPPPPPDSAGPPGEAADTRGYALPESDEALLAECRVETFTAGGPGGQHQNRSETGVRLTHGPTGLRASARSERSQHRNKRLALARLRRKLEHALYEAPSRIPTSVPQAQKKRRLEEKRRRSRTKALRRRPDPEE